MINMYIFDVGKLSFLGEKRQSMEGQAKYDELMASLSALDESANK